MWEKFNKHARYAIVAAQEEATRLGHSYVGTEHLLQGLIKDPLAWKTVKVLGVSVYDTHIKDKPNLATKALIGLDVNLPHLKNAIETVMAKGQQPAPPNKNFTPGAKQVLEYAFAESRSLGHEHIGTEHLLLGLLREQGVSAGILSQTGVNYAKTCTQIAILTGTKEPPFSAKTAAAFRREFPLWGNMNEKARTVMIQARQESRRFQHSYIGPEHIFLAILKEKPNNAALALLSLVVRIDFLRHIILSILPKGNESHTAKKTFNAIAKVVLLQARREAQVWSDGTIGTEHLLLGILREEQGSQRKH